MKLTGTKTETNLVTAFVNEGTARNRYSFWAAKAKKEGFEQIAAVFEETADQEKEHAERLFDFLEGGLCKVGELEVMAGTTSSTLANLSLAAQGEEYEWKTMYPAFAETARKEGFIEIANVLLAIAKAEKAHSERFKEFEKRIQTDTVFSSTEETTWQCRNCGYKHKGKQPPAVCPSCNHPRAYYERA